MFSWKKSTWGVKWCSFNKIRLDSISASLILPIGRAQIARLKRYISTQILRIFTFLRLNQFICCTKCQIQLTYMKFQTKVCWFFINNLKISFSFLATLRTVILIQWSLTFNTKLLNILCTESIFSLKWKNIWNWNYYCEFNNWFFLN